MFSDLIVNSNMQLSLRLCIVLVYMLVLALTRFRLSDSMYFNNNRYINVGCIARLMVAVAGDNVGAHVYMLVTIWSFTFFVARQLAAPCLLSCDT